VSASHRELREELGPYALGQLTGDRWRAVHEHLATCASCRADLEEIAPVAGLLGAARDRVRLDDDGDPGYAPPLSDELIAEVRAAGPAADRVASRRAVRWPAVAAAAAVLVAGGAGYLVGTAGAADVPLETVAVRALDPQVTAQAALVPHTWGMEVKLTATGFTAGEAYTVTVTDETGRTVGAGEFLGTGGEEMRCNLNSSVLRADASLVQVRGADGEVVLDATV
jgi:anti-sigma factor RsiW